MVFEGLLVSVLNRFLGPYVKNLDASQLSVGIWSGDVHLERLEVKETALSQLDIPLRVYKGYLGKLKLNVPWKNLYTDPVLVEVEDVFVVAGPSLAVRYNPGKEEQEERDAKQKKLKEIDEARKKSQDPKGDKKPAEDPGFVEKLVSQIIRNVQVTVKNIHIRFEDAVTKPNTPFSFGITLDSLLLQSTDGQWKVHPTGIADDGSNLIYKVARLQCLALYWNSGAMLFGTDLPYDWMETLEKEIARPGKPLPEVSYVLLPLSAVARLTLCTRPGQDMATPQIFAQLVVEEVSLSIERHQYLDFIALVDSFDRLMIARRFRKYRPFIPLRSDPSSWWKYAYDVVMEDVRRRRHMWSWEHIKKHRERCRRYVQLYTEKLVNVSPSSHLVAEILELEDELDIFNITVCRQLAESEAKKEEEKEKEESSRGWWGWASNWVAGTEPTSADSEEKKPVLPSEQELAEEKEKLYSAIGYSEKGKVADYPKAYVAHKVEFVLKQVSFQLLNRGDNVGHLVTESVSTTIQHRPSSKNFSIAAAVGGVSMRGSVRQGELPEVISSNMGDRGRSSEHPLLVAEFEMHPLDSRYDQRIKLSLQPLVVTYDVDTVDEVVSMFMLPRDVRLQKLSSSASMTLNQLRTQTRAGLEHAVNQRRLVDIDVMLSSPTVIIPEGGMVGRGGGKLIFDPGVLRVTSDIKNLVPDVHMASQKELEEAFYDKLTVRLSGLNMMLADGGDNWRSAKRLNTSHLFLLRPMALELTVQKSLLPNDTRLPGLKIGGHLPSVSMAISDRRLIHLLKFLLSMSLPTSLRGGGKKNADSPANEKDYLPSFDDPLPLVTSDLVTTVSETVVKAVALRSPTVMEDDDEDDDDDFFTASEGEDDDVVGGDGRSKGQYRSSTKVALDFSISEVTLVFSEIKDSVTNRRLTMAVTSLGLQVGVRTWDTNVMATVSYVLVLDHYNNDQIQLFAGGSEESQKFFTFSYAKVNRDSPYYQSQFHSTEQSMETVLTTASLRVQRESLSNLVSIARDIHAAVILSREDADEKGPPSSDLATPRESVKHSAQTVEPPSKAVVRAPGEKEIALSARVLSAEITLFDKAGDIALGHVEGMTTNMEAYANMVAMETKIKSISIIDVDRKAIHPQVLVPVSSSGDVVTTMVMVHRGATEGEGYANLSRADLEVTLSVQRVQATVALRFVNRLVGFAQQLRFNDELMKRAKDTAQKTATKTVESLKERSSSRVRLSVQIAPPNLVLPLSASSKSAVVISLGQVSVLNSFQLATDVYPLEKGMTLSSEGRPAIVDVMSAKVSQVQIYRVSDLTAGADPAHSDHMILHPLEVAAGINRNLGSWCRDLPTVDVNVTLEKVELSFHPLDYHALMSIVESLEDGKYKEPAKGGPESRQAAPKTSPPEGKDTMKPPAPQPEGESRLATIVQAKATILSVAISLASDKHSNFANVSVTGLSTDLSLQSNSCVAVGVCLRGFSVAGSDPKALYPKLLYSDEDSHAINAKVLLKNEATKGAKYMDMRNYDVSVSTSVGQLTVVALMGFVHRLLNFVKELNVSKKTMENVRQSAREGASAAITKVQELHENGKRIKIEACVSGPRIKIPTHSKSERLLMVSLGDLSLSNSFHVVQGGEVAQGLPPIYEKFSIRLTAVEMFSVQPVAEWDSAVFRTPIMEQMSVLTFVSRNLSSSWYKRIPVISVDGTISTLQIHISRDEVEIFADIVEGNMAEDREQPLEAEEPVKEKDPQLEELQEKDESKCDSVDIVHPPPANEPVLYHVDITMDGVGIKLHNRREDFADLEIPQPAELKRDLSTAVADLMVTNMSLRFDMKRSGEMDSQSSVEDFWLDDCKPTTTNVISHLIEKSQSQRSRILGFHYTKKFDGDQDVMIGVSSPQININFPFIMQLQKLVVSSLSPLNKLKKIKPVEEEGPKILDPLEERKQFLRSKYDDSGPELIVTLTVDSPRVLLVEDATNKDSRLLLLECNLNSRYKKMPSQQSITASISQLKISSTSYRAVEDTELLASGAEVMAPCSMVVYYSTFGENQKSIGGDLGQLKFTISPATIRLVLRVLKSYQPEEEDADETGPTAPQDLWLSRTLDGSIWYLQSPPDEAPVEVDESAPRTRYAVSQIYLSKGEMLSLSVEAMSIVIQQENPKTGTLSSALCLLIGCYGQKGFYADIKEWTGKMESSIVINMSVSYYNPNTDVWEPLMEPVVDSSGSYQPWSLNIVASKLDPVMERRRYALTPEERVDDYSPPEMTISICSTSALQLTLTRTCIGLASQLVEAYQRYIEAESILEHTDSGLANTFRIKNDLGDSFPVTLRPGKTLRGPDSKATWEIKNGESTYLQQLASDLQDDHQLGELLTRNRAKHTCKIAVKGFEAVDVALSNSGSFFYPLKSENPKYDGPKYSIVLTVDRVSSSEPTVVIISSPLALESHTSYRMAIYWSATERLPAQPGPPLTVLATQECTALPLNKAYSGYLFFQPLPQEQSVTSTISSQGLSWKAATSKGCHVQAHPYTIQVSPEEVSYQNKLLFSLKPHPHHVLHLYHPLLLVNLLPCDLEVTSHGQAIVIGQGERVALDKVDHDGGEKLSVKAVMEDEEYTGTVHIHMNSGDSSTFELKSTKSKTELSLCLRVEEVGSFHASIYSPYWIINKTGLTLQYKSKTSWTSSEKVVHGVDQRLLLYPQDEMVVRVIDSDGEHSKWSDSFSLDAVGSDGVFTCSWESSKAPRQMGTRVQLSKFTLTKIITISPFFMLHNKTNDCVSVIEKGLSRLVASVITLHPKELCPFWPETDSDLILVSLRDPASPGYSAPFNYTLNGSLLLRLPQASEQDACAVVADIRVTGSASIVSFTPYSAGDAPMELVNDFFFPIVYGQRKRGQDIAMVKQYQLEPQQRVLYAWDEPSGLQELVWGWTTETLPDKEEQETSHYKILSVRDGHGTFTIPEELRGLSPPETPASSAPSTRFFDEEVDKSSDAEAVQLMSEAMESDVDLPHQPPSSGDASHKQSGIRSSIGSAAKLVGSGAKKIGTGVAKGVKAVGGGVALGAKTVGGGVTTGAKAVGGGVASGAKKLTSGVRRVSRHLTLNKRRKDADKGYWVSFTDDLQRVILLTPEKNTSERARRDTEPKLVETEMILSLVAVGISLVNDRKGKEIAYIGLPQSEAIWEVNKRKRRWKPVETLLGKALEKLYDLDKKEVIPIEGSDYKVDFRDSDKLMLLNTKDRKKKGELRRSHFDGLRVWLGFSRKLTTIELRINQVQIDNQLPYSRNPTIFFCYPPSPSVASTTTPKPFIDGSLILRRSESADIHVIQFVQILVQEMGFTLDLDFVVELASLFDSLGREVPKRELMAEDVKTVHLSLRDSEAKLLSSAGTRSFFKFMHLSPLHIHLSFSLDISSEQKRKLDFYAERNFALKFVIDILHTFLGFIGRAKDAELKLGSFQIQERVLTNNALVHRVMDHYKQQGLYQLYSLVLGLEVLGNPVGFLRGLKEGTIGLFYHPIQGAVVGPGEFLEGLSIGTQQFIEGTLGGVAGMGARMTGVLGDAVAKLTFDSDFQKRRQQQSASLGQGLESFAMGVFHGVTGVVAQPVRGARKEGFLGLLKGTGKGVIGLVLRPTGGLIDFTSTTLSVVQKKTTLGDFELTQIRTLRYIGPDKIVYPYSPEKSAGYAMFLHVDAGKLAATDSFVGHLELTEDPLRTLMVTDSRTAIVKYNSFLGHWDEDWVVKFPELAGKVTTNNNLILFPMKEHHGISIPFGLGSGKKPTTKNLTVNTPDLARVAAALINRGFQQYQMQEEWNV